MAEFSFQEILPLGADETPYRELTSDGISTFTADGHEFLHVDPAVLTLLAREAMRDIAHLLRPGHLAQLPEDPRRSRGLANDRFVALDLLKNAAIAAGCVLPGCQDTGTAIVKGKKGQYVLTGGGDEAAIARGVFETYRDSNLRYSQMAPLDMWDEVNTGTNLPAEIEIERRRRRRVPVPVHGQGRRLGQQEPAVPGDQGAAQPDVVRHLDRREDPHARHRRLPAVPPGVVIGGTSAEYALEDRQAGVGPLPRHPADRGQRPRPRACATPSSRPRCCGSRRRPASAPSSAASTSATTSASSACPATAPRARSPSRCRARPTARRSARSPATACSSSSSRPTRPGSCPTSPATSSATTSCTSTSIGR